MKLGYTVWYGTSCPLTWSTQLSMVAFGWLRVDGRSVFEVGLFYWFVFEPPVQISFFFFFNILSPVLESNLEFEM